MVICVNGVFSQRGCVGTSANSTQASRTWASATRAKFDFGQFFDFGEQKFHANIRWVLVGACRSLMVQPLSGHYGPRFQGVWGVFWGVFGGRGRGGERGVFGGGRGVWGRGVCKGAWRVQRCPVSLHVELWPFWESLIFSMFLHRKDFLASLGLPLVFDLP